MIRSWLQRHLTSRRLPPCRFVVLFPGRTGSSFLISCLRSHPELLAEGEGLARKPPDEQQRWIHELYDTPRAQTCRAVGFKTKLKDVWNLEAFAGLLRARDVRVISLRRRNPVKLAVSTLNARRLHGQTGRWNRTAGVPALGPLSVTTEELAEMIDRCIAAQAEVDAFVRLLALPSTALDYEDLLEDRAEWLRGVTDFLGVAPQELHGTVEKATDDDLRVALADHDAHARHFAGTPLAAHFSA